jgi:type IV pilus assembly protein PilC
MSDVFAYEARNRSGGFISGTLAAATRSEAIDALSSRSLAITALVRANSPRGILAGLRTAATPAGPTRIALFRGLATLTRAGVALRRAIEIVAEQCRSERFQESLAGVAVELERGVRFSEALRRYPHEFPEIVSALVRAGEVGGALDEALERVAELLERGHALQRQVVAALAYPTVVASVALGLISVLVAGVVPEMASMLRGFNTPLPPATTALLAVADALRDPAFLLGILAATAAFGILVFLTLRTPKGAAVADRVRFGLPLLGPLARRTDVAACARTFGTMLHCGVPLAAALESAGSMTRSPRLRAVFASVGEAVALGQRIAPVFASSDLFDPLFVGLVRAGEEGGALDALLLRAADHLESEVRSAAATLAAVVEPVLIVVLGGVVAAIAAAVLVPLYSTIGSIS